MLIRPPALMLWNVVCPSCTSKSKVPPALTKPNVPTVTPLSSLMNTLLVAPKPELLMKFAFVLMRLKLLPTAPLPMLKLMVLAATVPPD